MQLRSGPNPFNIYHYMKIKGYTPDFKIRSGKTEITFTKELHNAQFPTVPTLKGLVVVHKIVIDIEYGCVKSHWMENRYVNISEWAHIHLLEELFQKSIEYYKEVRDWLREGWLEDLKKSKEKEARRIQKKQNKKEIK